MSRNQFIAVAVAEKVGVNLELIASTAPAGCLRATKSLKDSRYISCRDSAGFAATGRAQGFKTMSRSAYPLKLPTSVKTAAVRLAKADGVSLNQFIAVAVAEKSGSWQPRMNSCCDVLGAGNLKIC